MLDVIEVHGGKLVVRVMGLLGQDKPSHLYLVRAERSHLGL